MITKAMIDRLIELPDAKLKSMLNILLSSTGFNSSGKQINLSEEKLAGIRAVLREITENDLEHAEHLIELYKNGG